MEKKNALLEEELDSVTGGTIIQSYKAFWDLQKAGAISKDEELNVSTMRDTFNKYGVMVDDHGGLVKDNRYFIDGKEVCYNDALEHVKKQLK